MFHYREPSTFNECSSDGVAQCDIESHLISDCEWKSNSYSYIPDNVDGCLEDGYLLSHDFEENSLI